MFESDISHNTIFCEKFGGMVFSKVYELEISHYTIFSAKFGTLLLFLV